MADHKDNPARKVKTVPFRMSFPNVLTPREDEDSGRKSYQLSMLFPPGTNMDPFKAALKAAMTDKFGDDPSKWPRCKRGPKDVIRDFAEYNREAKKALPGDWAGWVMIRANCADKYPPGVVGPIKGADGKFPRVTDPREVYGGRWARSTIDAYHFDGKKNDGVTFGLKNLQLLKHDSNFGGAQQKAEDDFDNAPEEWAGGEGDDFDKGAADNGNGNGGAANSGGDWN